MFNRRLINPKLPSIWHGGDYSPEQWPTEVWDEDVRLMQLTRFTVATMGMFAWARMEPEEGRFDFDWLDDVVDRLTKGSRCFILGTPSAAPPAWLSKKYPETLRTGADGVRRGHGNRVNFNWASPIYREKCQEIVRRMAARYGAHPNLVAWHFSNEYGGEDYSEQSKAAFRQWLRRKFANDLDALNHAYWSAFWSHTYGDWDEIDPPGQPYGESAVNGLTVDWMRFNTDQAVDFMLHEAEPLRTLSPGVPVTTNMMGTYPGLDYRRFARHLDFISWDSYPAPHASHSAAETWVATGFKHDLMRSLKPDAPWLLMEYTPSSANWYDHMTLKRPGMHRFESYHALAHGADGLQYFQWRQSRGCAEQFHGAVVSHSGAENTRVFNEILELGKELEGLTDLPGSLVKSDIAIVFDWENRWALDAACGPVRAEKGYEQTCIDHYKAFYNGGYAVDIVGMDDDLSRYRLVVAPMAYSLRPGFVDRLHRYVEDGGVLLTTYLSGWVDENSLVFEGGFLAPLRKLLGIWSEELDALQPGQGNRLEVLDRNDLGVEGRFEARDFCELIHTETAEVWGVFKDDFYAGRPALTENRYGRGSAVYVGARMEQGFLDKILLHLARRVGAEASIDVALPQGVIARLRKSTDRAFHFLLNSGSSRVTVNSPTWGQIHLGPFDATMLERSLAILGEVR